MKKTQLPKTTNLQDKSRKSWVPTLATGTIVVGILAVSVITYPQPVINATLIDVSESIQNYPFPGKQTYQSFLAQDCQSSIENLTGEGDRLLEIKFASESYRTRDATFDNRNKPALLEQCQQAATRPDGIAPSEGTFLLPVLGRFQAELKSLRTQGISYPFALTVFIQANEPQRSGHPENIEDIKNILQEIVKEGGAITIIGPEVGLQKELAKIPADVPHTRICTFENASECRQWIVDTARNFKTQLAK